MTIENLALFALNATRDFGERVAAKLAVPLTEHEEREFEDGEHKARPLVSIRAKDAYIIQSLYWDDRQSVNDKLCRLLFFAGALRDAGAGRVTAVIPYLAYARKERKTQPRDPVTTRYVALLIEAASQVYAIVDRYLEAVEPLGVKNDGKGLDYFIPEEDRKRFATTYNYNRQTGAKLYC